MHDDDDSAEKQVTARANAVHDDQSILHPHIRPAAGTGYGRSLPSCGDAVLVHHAVGVVDRLTDLITDAVRASDDDRARALDRILQKAEELLALTQTDGLTARTAP